MDEAANDPKFLATLARWFESQPEMLVLFRYRYGAGSRDYELHSSLASLAERLRRLPAGAAISAFRRPQLPLRGCVDDAFIDACLNAIPDGVEYLLIETVPAAEAGRSWFHHGTGESHDELRDDLEWSRGKPVAAGVHPDWPGSDEDTIHAYVPDGDGVIRRGAY